MSPHIRTIQQGDVGALHALLRRVGVFEPHEIRVAEELIEECLAGSSDYHIYVAENGEARRADTDASAAPAPVGYVCHGHNPVTDAIHDVYWIAVDPAAQGAGIGKALLGHAERCVRDARGRGIVIETSGRAEYASARRLYEVCGYAQVANIADFYKPGDAMLMYLKFL